ncbi:hypothetical protein FOXB_09463 [Fusarium oxysporum f. sp. conglutinans Fo5176]|uniref:Uncharacterized protein n=1 Tax=Fusarium oxysporum (strain Fo5176) TaxID=660025 RepID=F9FST2_FUSOF|nr:hypothetical protein FOXB_09463 [Fusarium oxysporum f. sp. conglutinans Fo5176]
MELHTKALHEAEIQDRLQALEYKAHVLMLGSGPLAPKFGLTKNPIFDAKSFLSVSESLKEGEILEFPYIEYWPSARKQAEIQRRTKVLENDIRVMKWNLGLPDTMSNPVPSVLVDAVECSVSRDVILKSTPSADSYCLAPEFEALLDELQNSRMIKRNKRLYYISTTARPKQQKGSEIMIAHHFRRYENPDIAGAIPELDPKLNNVEILFLRRECKPRYRYSFKVLEADISYDSEWLRFLQQGGTLSGDIEVLCIRNQKVCGMIHNSRDPIFEIALHCGPLLSLSASSMTFAKSTELASASWHGDYAMWMGLCPCGWIAMTSGFLA